MSTDVQAKKRRDKRRKRDDDDSVPGTPERLGKRQSSVSPAQGDMQMHIEKEHETGGHWCAKIVFFILLSILVSVIAMIVLESRGKHDVVSTGDSQFSQYFEGWVEEPKDHDEDHGALHAGHSHDDDDGPNEAFEEEDLDNDGDEDDDHNVSQEADKDDDDDNDQTASQEAALDDDNNDDDDDDDNDNEDGNGNKQGNLNNDNDDEDDDRNDDNDDENNDNDKENDNDDDDENQDDDQDGDDEDDDDNDDQGKLNIATGDEPFDEDDINSQEDVFDNDVGEEIYLKKLKEEAAAAKSREEAAASEEPNQGSSVAVKIIVGIVLAIVASQVLLKSSKSSDAEQSRQSNLFDDDPLFDDDFFNAEQNLNQNPKKSLKMFEQLQKQNPQSIRARIGKARALDLLSKVYRSNDMLKEAVDEYEKLITEQKLLLKNSSLYVEIANTCTDRMRFLGSYKRAVLIQKYLVKHFPKEIAHRNQLGILLILSNRFNDAKEALHEALLISSDDGVALVHYGFVLKQLGDLEGSVNYLQKGIETNANETVNGLFYLTLGDCLIRLGKPKDANKVFVEGADKELFLSPYQRSLYNVPRLKAKPFWTSAETTYGVYLKKIQDNWKIIAEEGTKILKELQIYQEENEGLREKGDWKQFELFTRGRKIESNCAKTPITCALIDQFDAAKCSRGQVKFSVILPGTHVWPHCGPTNCRIRAHLGLVVPANTYIRVKSETRSWEAGQWLIFDDSFEHEVWHNGTGTRLVLIIDVWHPELTADERRSLAPI